MYFQFFIHFKLLAFYSFILFTTSHGYFWDMLKQYNTIFRHINMDD